MIVQPLSSPYRNKHELGITDMSTRLNTRVTIDASTLLSLLAAASKELRELNTAWVDTDCVKEARKLKCLLDHLKVRFDIALDAYVEATREEEEE